MKKIKLFVFIVLLLAYVVAAIPPLPSVFWGTITINGITAPDGTVVKAYINGINYGQTQVTSGYYILNVNGDDTDTSQIEGGKEGDIVTFTVNDQQTPQTGVWHSSITLRLDLTLTAACIDNDGDGYGNPGSASCAHGSATDCNDYNAAIHPGATEICNNIDDNCNSQIDEGSLWSNKGSSCSVGVGACQATGVFTCNASNPSGATICNANPGTPTTEICDGIDNNCNGIVDEGFNLGQSCSAGVGECLRTGTMVCKADHTGSQCNAVAGTPVTETCDGKDNDCNGVIDNGFNLGQSCSVGVGSCLRTGTLVCKADFSGSQCNVVAGQPSTEICDGIDNDCNGVIDNGFNLGQSCSVGVGACLRTGTSVCKTDHTGSQCNAVAGTPGTEICDGIDNNCNGVVDEGCQCTNGATQQCGSNVGECRFGTETCTNGVWGSCVGSVGPTNEICDSKDNDCNGIIDNGFNLGQSCSAGVGACLRTGTLVCKADFSGSQCNVVAGQPSTEICDGIDNDCNGVIDNGFNLGQSCSAGVGECLRTGTIVCKADHTGSQCNAVAGTPVTEICDGKDNDCNGVNDNGFNLGQSCSVGVGACLRTGTLVCKADFSGTQCSATPGTPGTEICDGIDNNCNGVVDEGCQCTNGATQQCGSNVGECRFGTETCTNGIWGSCVGSVGPTNEICDGKDNDCNGVIDNGFNLGQSCSVGVGACLRTGTSVCKTDHTGSQCNAVAGTPGTEICDGIDNNCNGVVDEGCQCTNGATQQCGSNVGECRFGTETCTNGIWGSCVGSVGPTNEICDGKDNDCNGKIDNNLTQSCSNACYSGQKTCSNGVWGACSAQSLPLHYNESCTVAVGECKRNGHLACNGQCDATAGNATAEICDGKDNNCNGIVDEGCGVCTPGATRSCASTSAACKSATQTCQVGGIWGPCVTATPQPEICDGKDNDCDGFVDEGFNVGQSCSVGIGNCLRRGVFVCTADGSGTKCNAVPGTPTVERCDGSDNNCNGLIDEEGALGCTKYYYDSDNDRFGTSDVKCLCRSQDYYRAWQTGDCNDNDPTVHPWAQEKCDGKDNNCNGQIDEENAIGCTRYYYDFDNDGYGTYSSKCLCSPQGYYRATKPGDCKDNDSAVNPGAVEICNNGKDDNCNGLADSLDPMCKDVDHDGSLASVDCDDYDAAKFPGNTEICDGKDNNCNGLIDEGCPSYQAKESKQQAVRLLAQAITRDCSVNNQACITLRTALDYTEQSLAEKYWLGNNRLSAPSSGLSNGLYVFVYENMAMNSCRYLSTPECKDVLVLLSRADSELAKVSIEDAKAVESKYNKATLAEKYYYNGYIVRETNPVIALMYFKYAWLESQRVISTAKFAYK